MFAGASTTALTWTGAAVVALALVTGVATKQGAAPQAAPGAEPPRGAQLPGFARPPARLWARVGTCW
ncbi:hypothetical protein [Streptomyces sp. 7N604]|uniref:hypothetical protein n=1 Tax=Streptomyces sp. 7N604 TaxID=3457415 RepID=UPI003FCFAD6E